MAGAEEQGKDNPWWGPSSLALISRAVALHIETGVASRRALPPPKGQSSYCARRIHYPASLSLSLSPVTPPSERLFCFLRGRIARPHPGHCIAGMCCLASTIWPSCQCQGAQWGDAGIAVPAGPPASGTCLDEQGLLVVGVCVLFDALFFLIYFFFPHFFPLFFFFPFFFSFLFVSVLLANP